MKSPKNESNFCDLQNQAAIKNKQPTKTLTIRATKSSSLKNTHTYKKLLHDKEKECIPLAEVVAESKKKLKAKDEQIKRLKDAKVQAETDFKKISENLVEEGSKNKSLQEIIDNLVSEKDKAEKNYKQTLKEFQIQSAENITKLKNNIDYPQKEITQLNEAQAESEKKLINLQDNHEKDIGDKDSDIRIYKNTIAKQKKRITQLHDDFSKLIVYHKEVENNLTKEVNNLKELTVYQVEISTDKLIKEISKNKLLQEKNNNLVSEKGKVEKNYIQERQSCQNAIDDLKKEIIQLEEAQAEKQQNDLLEHNQKIISLTGTYTKEIFAYDKEINSLKLQINGKNTELERIQNELKEQKIKLDEERNTLQKNLNNLLVKKNQLEEESFQVIKIIKDLEEKNNFLKKAEEENLELLKDLEGNKKIIQKLENDINDTRDKQTNLSWKNNDLQKQNQETLTKEKFLQQEKVQLQNELKEAKNNVQSINNINSHLQNRLNDREQELSQTKNNLIRLEEKYKSIQNELTEEKERNKHLLKDLKDENPDLKEKIQKYESTKSNSVQQPYISLFDELVESDEQKVSQLKKHIEHPKKENLYTNNLQQYTIQQRSSILSPLFFVIAGAVAGGSIGILALHFLTPLILDASIGIGIHIGSLIIVAVAGGGGIGYLTNIVIDKCYNINVQVA